MTLELTPRSYTSKVFLTNDCEQNPLLNILVTPQTSLEQLFSFLEEKWKAVDEQVSWSSSLQRF